MITFNGISSDSVGVEVMPHSDLTHAKRILTKTHIPGRNGYLLQEENAFENVSQEYTLLIVDAVKATSHSIAAWLLSSSGYQRLEDTSEPDYYRMARIDNGLSLNNLKDVAGSVKITFDCLPQFWLKSGETEIEASSGMTIINPTSFEANPLIHIVGNGFLTINDVYLELSAAETFIDCERKNCFYGETNLNSSVRGASFPHLSSGENLIVFEGDISSVKITPRWWTI